MAYNKALTKEERDIKRRERDERESITFIDFRFVKRQFAKFWEGRGR